MHARRSMPVVRPGARRRPPRPSGRAQRIPPGRGCGPSRRKLATGPRRREQEGKAGPDHVRADHHQKAWGQVARRPSDMRAGLAVRGVDEAPPVRRGLCPTGQPPLLPGLNGSSLQPGDDGQDAGATDLELADAVLERERRGEEAVHHRRAGGCRVRPRVEPGAAGSGRGARSGPPVPTVLSRPR